MTGPYRTAEPAPEPLPASPPNRLVCATCRRNGDLGCSRVWCFGVIDTGPVSWLRAHIVRPLREWWRPC